VASYGGLAIVLALITLIGPVRAALAGVAWAPSFREVETADGFATPGGAGTTLRALTHPGTLILLVAGLSALGFRRAGLNGAGNMQRALRKTARSAVPATIGIVSMVGLSALMEHTGMTQLLAETTAGALDTAFPLFSPLVGMLGAFATGSNNNSNVLFAGLQDHVAALLGIAPSLLVAAQTTGGSLGSMIAPAKIIVGCSTVGLRGRDGEVLRVTLPYGLAIALAIGALTLLLAGLG
jgi:lactate permease